MSYGDKKVVLSFDMNDIYDVKRMLLDSDVKGSMEFLKKLEKRLGEAIISSGIPIFGGTWLAK